MDFIGPVRAVEGYKYIATIIDRFSHLTFLEATRDCNNPRLVDERRRKRVRGETVRGDVRKHRAGAPHFDPIPP
jgi:hypothetical protein